MSPGFEDPYTTTHHEKHAIYVLTDRYLSSEQKLCSSCLLPEWSVAFHSCQVCRVGCSSVYMVLLTQQTHEDFLVKTVQVNSSENVITGMPIFLSSLIYISQLSLLRLVFLREGYLCSQDLSNLVNKMLMRKDPGQIFFIASVNVGSEKIIKIAK